MQGDKKLKRHDDAILCIYSPKGPAGTDVITASEGNFRIWSFGKKTIFKAIDVKRPNQQSLDEFINNTIKHTRLIPAEKENFCPDHPLNSVRTFFFLTARRPNKSKQSNRPIIKAWLLLLVPILCSLLLMETA